ncbi:hypothetical protein GZ212_10630 [Mangrovimonas sp. CR14]|uniref:hypothetical protein n=1 Tax=Mangrovimonas sp. CR14 TaxID=2706120 RepID=UPI00141FA5C5|nr:hypothetical protein [Mangrovimonas sp. CR14]NIK92605.1 hypothetical protein [Mangrovimonas sp. CR14]
MKFKLLLFLIFPFGLISQNQLTSTQTFSFNLATTYVDHLTNREVLFLTNSNDNSYKLRVVEAHEEDKMELYFTLADTLFSNMIIPKSDFYKAEIINVGQGYKTREPYEINLKDYKVERLKDTIIKSKSCSHYKIGVKPRKHSMHIINQLEITDIKPIILAAPMYQIWENGKLPINGYFERFYFEDKKGNIVECNYEQQQQMACEKYLSIKL